MFTRALNSPRTTRFFFNRIAPLYRWLTDNALWRESLHELARHFPPSAADLMLLDVGCGHGNSAFAMLAKRPDLRIVGLDFSAVMLRMARRASLTDPVRARRTNWAQADVLHLPLPDNSMDAVTGHSVLYMLEDRAAFLRETLRVLRPGGRLILLDPIARPWPIGVLLRDPRKLKISAALLAWHSVSRLHNRFTLAQMVNMLEEAGFERVLTERAVDGFGVLSRGEKPYTHLSTFERVAGTAARDSAMQPEATDGLLPISAVALGTASRGPFVFILVRQSPDKPPWAIQPGELMRWDAAMVTDRSMGGRPCLLTFTSLPKAVEFMQPAVKSGALLGISKIAKFDKAVARTWGADLLLNPPFEALRSSPRYTFEGVTLPVDPSSAVTGEE